MARSVTQWGKPPRRRKKAPPAVELPPSTILDAMADSRLFARWFKNPETWVYWSVFLSALFGLPLDPASLEIFTQCTGRTVSLPGGYNEAWLCVGRRGGKSIALALTAVYLAVFRDWSDRLVPGERATVLVIAADKRQARVIFRYILALITETPLIAGLVDGEPTQERVDLTNGVSIEISTASYKTVRGYSLIAALCDEIAFWMGEDSANPDAEILAAIRPAMITMLPDAMLLCASSPHAKRGALYEAFRQHYGKDDSPVLYWRATTLTMNSSVPQSVVDEAFERDPAAAAAEFNAEFRSDVSSWLSLELIEAAVDTGVAVRPPQIGKFAYHCGVDPSGGAKDSYTAAVSHVEGNQIVLDALLEIRPPFDPSVATEQVVALLKSYGLTSCTGDRYAAQWVVSAFAKHGVTYRHSDRDRSQIYNDTLPLFTSGRARLLDNGRLVAQFAGLESKASSMGRIKTDHGPNGRDDACSAAALSMVSASVEKKEMTFVVPEVDAFTRPNFVRSFGTVGAHDMFSNASGPPGGWPRNSQS
jgi:hypothetical protein